MICFNCGYKVLSSKAKECHICGMKFSQKCTSCGSFNPQFSKYCFNCGDKFAEEYSTSTITNYHTLTENRKKVSVIFADISGFTSMSEKLDPEEVREIINECFNYITKPVYELGGTVDKYIGDCIMILFGAKYTHGDDVKRAVICAMRIMEAIEEYSKEKLSSRGLKVQLSIGINYGLVVTGSVGNYFDKDYTVMGDVVNTAQRLQANADKGSVFVSESVYNETKEEINYLEGESIEVKNKEKPIKYYVPINVYNNNILLNKVLIDREREINQMQEIYKLNSEKKCITVIGERGIGKTSLIKNFIDRNINDGKKIWIDCNPIHKNRVYYTISNILFNIMNINFNDTERVKKNRLASYLDYILSDNAEAEIARTDNFLRIVMGIERENEFQNILNSMDYEDIEKEIYSQVIKVFESISRKYRLLVVIDDIQWADSNSIVIMKKVIESISLNNFLLIFASRYEIGYLKVIYKEKIDFINLRNLDKEGTEKLSCNLLECNKLDNNVLEVIIKFTNGNPLFIEEFIKSLKRNNFYRIEENVAFLNKNKDITLPDNIEKLVMANISELDDSTRKFLQISSIIGKTFDLSWVRYLIDKPYDESKILKKLTEMNIIDLKSTEATTEILQKIYIFKQDTVREAVYGSVLNKDKKFMFESIVDMIETKYDSNIENYYEMLCYYCESAGLMKKAKKYYLKAAEKNKREYSFENALKYYKKYLDNTVYNEGLNEKSNRINALKNIGYIYSVLGNKIEALTYLNRALSYADLSDEIYAIKIMLSEILKDNGEYDTALAILDEIQTKIRKNSNLYGKLLQLKCSILSITGKKEALQIAKESEKILLGLHDYKNLSVTMSQAGTIYFINGSIQKSIYYLNKAYKYAEKINNLSNMARISGNLGIICHASGMISKALENLNKSIDISKKISAIKIEIAGTINLGILYMEKGKFKKAKNLFIKALKKTDELSMIYEKCITLTNFGDLMYELGNYAEAKKYYEKSIKVAKEHNLNIDEKVNYFGLAKLYLHDNKYNEAEKLLKEAYKTFNEINEMSSIGDYYRYYSKLQLGKKNIELAMEYCDKSIEIYDEIKSDKEKLKSLRLKGYILIEKNNPEEAINYLSESISLAQQLDSDYEAGKGFLARYNVFLKLNQIDKAQNDLIKAKEAKSKIDKCKWILNKNLS